MTYMPPVPPPPPEPAYVSRRPWWQRGWWYLIPLLFVGAFFTTMLIDEMMKSPCEKYAEAQEGFNTSTGTVQEHYLEVMLSSDCRR